MIVKAIRNDDGHYQIIEGKKYIVYACIFEIKPEGPKHSKLNFYIETEDDYRAVFVGHDATKFEIVDSTVPNDWVASVIDLKQLQKDLIESFIKTHQTNTFPKLSSKLSRTRRLFGDKKDIEQRQELIHSWGNEPYCMLVNSFLEMHEYQFNIAVHDDNMDEEHYAVFSKYKQKYERLWGELL